jgi:hypothetical protein
MIVEKLVAEKTKTAYQIYMHPIIERKNTYE